MNERWGRIGVVIFAAALAGCTEVVDVDIGADPCVQDLAARMTIETFDGTGQLRETTNVEAPSFPSGVRLVSNDTSAGWRVRANLFDDNDVLVSSAEAGGEFEQENARIQFEDTCLGVICQQGETCHEGRCIDDGDTFTPAEPIAECPAWLFVSAEEGSDEPTCGSFESPCQSVEHIVAPGGAASPTGAVITIEEGIYDRGFWLREGSYGGAIVVRGWPGRAHPIFRATGQDTMVVHASNVTIQSLDVEGATQHGIIHNVFELQSNLRIRDCVFRNNGTDAAETSASGLMIHTFVDNFDVEDCTFEDHPNRGLWIGNSDLGRVRRNRFVRNRQGMLLFGVREMTFADNVLIGGAFGVSVSDELRDTEDIVFERNYLCGHTDRAFSMGQGRISLSHNTFAGNALGLTGGSVDARVSITRNIFAQHSTAAIDLAESAAPTEESNLFSDNAANYLRYMPMAEVQEGNPGVFDLERCTLERTSDRFNAFGAP